MNNLRNYLIAMVSFVLLFTIMVFISPGVGYGQGKPPSPVEVVNTPTVNAQQRGSWNVGITGTPTIDLVPGATVNIGNMETNPVPVLDVNNAMQPFTRNLYADLNEGATEGASESFMVPFYKRLVIEYVTLRGVVPSGQKMAAILFTGIAGSEVLPNNLVLTEQGMFGTRDRFVASLPMRAYADAGTTVSFNIYRNESGGSGSAALTISGYLVNVP